MVKGHQQQHYHSTSASAVSHAHHQPVAVGTTSHHDQHRYYGSSSGGRMSPVRQTPLMTEGFDSVAYARGVSPPRRFVEGQQHRHPAPVSVARPGSPTMIGGVGNVGAGSVGAGGASHHMYHTHPHQMHQRPSSPVMPSRPRSPTATTASTPQYNLGPVHRTAGPVVINGSPGRVGSIRGGQETLDPGTPDITGVHMEAHGGSSPARKLGASGKVWQVPGGN